MLREPESTAAGALALGAGAVGPLVPDPLDILTDEAPPDLVARYREQQYQQLTLEQATSSRFTKDRA